MSDGMRIALIGVVASLLGTLIGGGVTYAVTQSQISSTKAESRRAERLNAYSAYLADTERFWIYISTITEEGLQPKAVTDAQRAELNTYGETLIGDYAQAGLLAPPSVGQFVRQLQRANIVGWNAVAGGSIDYRQLDKVELKRDGLIKQFAAAMKEDLGTQ